MSRDMPDWYYDKDFWTQMAIRKIMSQPYFDRKRGQRYEER